MVEAIKVTYRDGAYRVDRPNWEGGEVVPLSDYATLERQIADLRAELVKAEESWAKAASNGIADFNRAEAAEAENVRLRALPLKEEVERVLEQIDEQITDTYEKDGDGYYDTPLTYTLRAARALLSRLRAGEHVEIDPNELAFADLRASGGVFPEFYGPSSASDAELAQAHDDMDTLGVPRQERGHTMSLAARVYWLAKQRIDALRAGEQEGWRSMETAPKDGTTVWAFLNNSGIRLVHWVSPEKSAEELGGDPEEYAGVWAEIGDHSEQWEPDLWLPKNALPAAPSDQGGDRG